MYIAIKYPFNMVYRIQKGTEFTKLKEYLENVPYELYDGRENISTAYKEIGSKKYPYEMKFKKADVIIKELESIKKDGEKAKNKIIASDAYNYTTKEDEKRKFLLSKKKKTISLIDVMIKNADKGASGFWTDDCEGCGNPNIFPEFEDGLKHGKYIQKDHILCPYDTRIITPSIKCTNYGDGCYHHCSIHLMKYANEEIIKSVLSKFKENLINGIYDNLLNQPFNSYDFPALLTEDELNLISKREKEEYIKREEQCEKNKQLQDKTLNKKRSHLIVFHGNNLNPLPDKLFHLWNDLSKKYKNNISGNNQIVDYKDNVYRSDDFYFLYETIQYYHTFDSTIGLSVYHDYQLNREMFSIIFLTDGEDIEKEYFYNRNEMIIPCFKELKDIYISFKKLREENKDKWNHIYKITKYNQFKNAISTHNQIVCETCLFTEHCNGTSCLKNPDEILEVEIPKKEQFKINLHILEPCNYKCRHCFAHFDNHNILPVNVWKHIVDNCSDALYIHEFNIAGGEPLMYKDLPELIKYINYIGASCSIITNGFLMNEEWIKEYAKYFKTIGFSIDSFNPKTIIAQGRCNSKKEYLSKERFLQLCKWIKKYNPKCKIKMNTVVTSLNKNENMAKVIKEMNIPIVRWKVLKMSVFKNDSFDNSDIQISDEEYNAYIKTNIGEFEDLIETKDSESSNTRSGRCKTKTGIDIVMEQEVESSYIMIDINGYLVAH